jgi:hypothetical protein
MNKVEKLLDKFDCFAQPDVVLNVRSTARYAVHLQLDIRANALNEIRSVQSSKYIV